MSSKKYGWSGAAERAMTRGTLEYDRGCRGAESRGGLKSELVFQQQVVLYLSRRI